MELASFSRKNVDTHRTELFKSNGNESSSCFSSFHTRKTQNSNTSECFRQNNQSFDSNTQVSFSQSSRSCNLTQRNTTYKKTSENEQLFYVESSFSSDMSPNNWNDFNKNRKSQFNRFNENKNLKNDNKEGEPPVRFF